MLACYNFFKFVVFGTARSVFIIFFYVLVLFCLLSWEGNAIKEVVDPDGRQFVFQMLDDPNYFHISVDVSQIASLALFALICATMYHINCSLSLLLQHLTGTTVKTARRNIFIFNSTVVLLVLAYTSLFMYILCTPRDIEASVVLLLDLAFQAIFIVIYLLTVWTLYKKLRHFPSESMTEEIRSIK